MQVILRHLSGLIEEEPWRLNKEHTFNFPLSIGEEQVCRSGLLGGGDRSEIGLASHLSHPKRFSFFPPSFVHFYTQAYTTRQLPSQLRNHIKMSLKCHLGNGAIFFFFLSVMFEGREGNGGKKKVKSLSACSLSSSKYHGYQDGASDGQQCLNFRGSHIRFGITNSEALLKKTRL